MKFLTFNIVVLGALYFLYQFGGVGPTARPEPGAEPLRQEEHADSREPERPVVHALSERVAVLAQSVARLEGHVSEVLQRGEASKGARASQADPATQVAAKAAPKPSAEAASRSAGESPRAPRAKAPTRPATAPAEAGSSEFSAGATAATPTPGSEWSDGGATATPTDLAEGLDGSRTHPSASADAPQIEGELMSPTQRRNALLQLAQDMELHYLASAGE
ncbi:MAG: hypothetical protein JRG96_20320 [Deltaproteobacteria bacterium]|nr:hypothetical protein [Deltaproteobacteria bacterium]